MNWPSLGRPQQSMGTAVTVALAVLLVGCAATTVPGGVGVQAAPTILPAGASLDTSSPSPTSSLSPPPGCTNWVDPHASGGSRLAVIRKRGHLIAGVDQNTYQWGYRDSTNYLRGFDIDMIRQLAKIILGSPNDVEFVIVPNTQRAAAVEQGTVDIVAETMTITCSRLQSLLFSSVYYQAGQSILVPRGSLIHSISDLGGKRVCAIAGSTSQDRLAQLKVTPPMQRWAVLNETDCLVMLQQGQVDAISTDDTILRGLAAQDPNLVLVGGTFHSEPYGMAIMKGQTAFAAKVDAAIAQIETHTWGLLYAADIGGTVPAVPAPVCIGCGG